MKRILFSVFLVFFVLAFMGGLKSTSALTITANRPGDWSEMVVYAKNEKVSSEEAFSGVLTTFPMSYSVNALQGTIPSGTYTNTIASINFTTPGAGQASFYVSSNLAIADATANDWSETRHSTFFNIDESANYDLSGTFLASGPITHGNFRISLRNWDSGILVYESGPGSIYTSSFSVSGQTGTLAAGFYLFEMQSVIDTWSESVTSSALSTGFGESTLLISSTTPVPEPATIALLGIGLAGLGGRYIRKRFKRQTHKIRNTKHEIRNKSEID